jgi:hypothetical protein
MLHRNPPTRIHIHISIYIPVPVHIRIHIHIHIRAFIKPLRRLITSTLLPPTPLIPHRRARQRIKIQMLGDATPPEVLHPRRVVRRREDVCRLFVLLLLLLLWSVRP